MIASARTIARVERLTWVLAFGGLGLVALGVATARLDAPVGWGLGIAGAVFAAIGFALIPIRARMSEAPEGGAQSNPSRKDEDPS